MNGSFHRRLPDGALAPFLRTGWLVLSLLVLWSPLAVAGGSGSTNLFTPAADSRAASLGDYISATAGGGGLNTIYRYFIEVPAGLTRLRVQLFDADILQGAGESVAGRDKQDGGATTTTVTYTLIRPDGTTATTLTCDNAANPCTGTDNAWSTLLDSTTAANTANGHWELDVDMRTGTGDDLNAFGLRADNGDETSAGTELNVYYDSHTNLGVNQDATTNTRTYRFYPYITSGCTFAENDFDYDVGGGTGNGPGSTFGQVDLTSRSGGITRQVTSANLSANNAWKRNTLARWGTDNSSTDYGLWTLDQRISDFTSGGADSNNYTNLWFTNDQAAAGAPTANPSANSFRLYFPSDGGNKPAKPYIEQLLACIPVSSCGVTPAVGVARDYRVTVRVVNPTGDGQGTITFSNTNVVTARIPGGAVTYRGGVVMTAGGTVVAQPAVGGSGDITWNPGTLTAGSTSILSYVIRVTPAGAGRTVVTGTPAANGTRATWRDSTGNTTQARALFSTGGICELAISTTVITPAVVSGLTARQAERGNLVEWTTASEIGTTGFDLLRFDRASRSWVKVNERLLPALITAPQGGAYRFPDSEAPPQGLVRYKLVEHLTNGASREHGPFRVEVAERGPVEKRSEEAVFSRQAWAPQPLEAKGAGAGIVPGPRNKPVDTLKIGVGATGLYRLTASTLAGQLGITPPAAQALIDKRALMLTNFGKEVPWFESGDGLLFYGVAADSPYTRENVYRLSFGKAASPPAVNGGNPIAPMPEALFQESSHREQDLFAATVVATNPESDYWFWDFLVAGDASFGTRSFALGVDDLGSGAARLNVQLQGASKSGVKGEHHAMVRVNGTDVGAAQWTGITKQVSAFDLPVGLLHEGQNTVEVTGLLDAGAPQSIFYVDSFDVDYPRRLRAKGDALAFRSGGAGTLTVGGFSSPNVVLLDVNQPSYPSRVTGTLATGSPEASVTFNAGTGSRYFAAGPSGLREPVWIRPDIPSQLRAPQAGAEYLIVTTSDLMGPAADLASLRSSQGLSTKVVDIEDVVDEFSYGIPSPWALVDFLAHARKSWKPELRYVLLAGNGSYDYRDILGQGGNLVPPLMGATAEGGLFASDYLLALGREQKDDGKNRLAIGRVPVTSAAGFQAYIDKLRAYEGGVPAPWALKAVLVADAEGGTDFQPYAERIAGFVSPQYSPERIYLSQQTVEATRAQLLSQLSDGAAVISYIGHGALDRLSSQGLLTSADVPALTNASRAPLLTAFTCTINRFEVPGFSPLGAVLANAPNGGAIAVFAPTGLNENTEGRALGELFYQLLGNGGGALRLGEVVQRAVSSYLKSGGTADQIKVYTLLGDPAIRLQKGALPPPLPSGPPGGPNG